MGFVPENMYNIHLPKMHKVIQHFPDDHIENIPAAVNEQLLPKISDLAKGSSVALLVGSRGIADINPIVKQTVTLLRDNGFKPFIVPSMGSHGGGTADGQAGILASFGITEETMGVPVISSMETTHIGTTPSDVPVYFDAEAQKANYIIPINRVKAHTDFHGPIESGLSKMLTIGAGNHKGCARLHQEGFDAFSELIPEAARVSLEKLNIPFGIAIVENAHEHTHTIEAIDNEMIQVREIELLKLSKELMPSLQFDKIDILIVEEIGKNISGAGMDPNIIGRDPRGPFDGFIPKITRIIMLGLTEETHNNGIGCGMADFITKDAYESIDLMSTYTNCIASGSPEGGKIPVIVKDEEEGIRAAIQSCAGIDYADIKIVKIKDTLHLSEIEVSETLLPFCSDIKKFKIL